MFKFELNPLDNKKDISLYVLFRTFQVNFQDISVTHCNGKKKEEKQCRFYKILLRKLKIKQHKLNSNQRNSCYEKKV